MAALVDKNGDGSDFVLEAESCWIEVDNYALYIYKDGMGGGIVELTPANDAMTTIQKMEQSP